MGNPGFRMPGTLRAFLCGLCVGAAIVTMLIALRPAVGDATGNGLIASLVTTDPLTFTRTAQTVRKGHEHGFISDGRRNYPVDEATCADTSDHSCDEQINTRHAPLESLVVHQEPLCDDGTCLHFVGFTAPDDSVNPPVPPCPACKNDREEAILEAAASNGEAGSFVFGERRYLSFWIQFGDADNAAPSPMYAVISQIWQDFKTQARTPPFFIGVFNKDAASVHVDFAYHNDEKEKSATVVSIDLTKGQWHHIDLSLTPSYPGRPVGGALVWVDRKNSALSDSEAVNAANDRSSHFYWGYTPDGNMQSDFRIRVGMYRPNPLFPISF